MSDDAAAGLFARSVFEEVTARLAGVDIEVIVPATIADSNDYSPGAGLGPDTPGPDYVVTGTIRSDASTARLTVRVVDARSGAQLWARRFDAALGEGGMLAAQEATGNGIAAGITGAVAEATVP